MSKESEVFERRAAPKGTLVMKQGEPGNCAYLVQSGRVVVYTEYEGMHIELARLGVGEIFGEMALSSDRPRSASVRTLEDSNLIVISRELFNQKLARSDSTIQAMVKMLIARMITANKAVVERQTDIKGLIKSSQDVYMAVLGDLPRTQRKTFESSVRPKLDDFLKTLEAFQARFFEKD